jgi:hypothetical protein
MERSDAKAVFRRAADALALHPAAGTRRVVSHRVTNLLRAGDELAVAERVLEFVESNWKRVRDESEANGKIVSKVESVFVDATDYSPLK